MNMRCVGETPTPQRDGWAFLRGVDILSTRRTAVPAVPSDSGGKFPPTRMGETPTPRLGSTSRH